MSLDSDVIEKTKKETKIEDNVGTPKVVIVHNDDFNTFEHVENCLMKICKMDQQTAKNKTWEVHNKGKARVAEGNDEFLKKVKLRLRAEGLSVTIENAD